MTYNSKYYLNANSCYSDYLATKLFTFGCIVFPNNFALQLARPMAVYTLLLSVNNPRKLGRGESPISSAHSRHQQRGLECESHDSVSHY